MLLFAQQRNLQSHGALSCELNSIAGLWVREHLRSALPVQVLGWAAAMTRAYLVAEHHIQFSSFAATHAERIRLREEQSLEDV